VDKLFLSIVKINSNKIWQLSHTSEDDFDVVEMESKNPSVRLRRKATLALMRLMLTENGMFTPEQSQDIEIQRLESGEPILVSLSDLNRDLPWISISHSGPWIACLLSDAQSKACIDMEDLSKNRPVEKLAAHAFSDEETQYVLHMGKIGFYKLWTAKEAIAKCRGKGLSEALKMDIGSPFLKSAPRECTMVKLGEDSYSLYQKMTSFNVLFTIAKRNVVALS